MHPSEVVYLEHDGKVLLVDEDGLGPAQPVKGRTTPAVQLRFPTRQEVELMGIQYDEKAKLRLRYDDVVYLSLIHI